MGRDKRGNAGIAGQPLLSLGTQRGTMFSHLPGMAQKASVKARGSAGWGLRPQTPFFKINAFQWCTLHPKLAEHDVKIHYTTYNTNPH